MHGQVIDVGPCRGSDVDDGGGIEVFEGRGDGLTHLGFDISGCVIGKELGVFPRRKVREFGRNLDRVRRKKYHKLIIDRK